MPAQTLPRPARTRRSKPFADVSIEDVVTALFDVDDVRDVLRSHWDEVFIDRDSDEELPVPPMRKSALTPEQWGLLTDYFARSFAEARQHLAPIAAMPAIAVTRRLSRLSDLGEPLGVHWSAGELPCAGTEGYGQHVVMADVASEDVDWVTTIARGMFWWGPEREISIVAGAPVRLRSMTFGNAAVATA